MSCRANCSPSDTSMGPSHLPAVFGLCFGKTHRNSLSGPIMVRLRCDEEHHIGRLASSSFGQGQEALAGAMTRSSGLIRKAGLLSIPQ